MLSEAVEESLDALKGMGRLEPVDAARIASIRSMAAALDGNPRNARLWREFRESFEVLAHDSDVDDSFEKLLGQPQTSVRDTEAGQTDVRR